MQLVPPLVCAGSLLLWPALAQSPITVRLGPQAGGSVIPEDFVGLSFGMKTLPALVGGAQRKRRQFSHNTPKFRSILSLLKP
jgi:hypothetical protein